MKDILLERIFEPERWKKAIDKGDWKGIKKSELKKLCEPEGRLAIYLQMLNGTFEIEPPHAAEIPKDDGTMRVVYANTPQNRVLLSVINDTMFDLTPEMVHPRCRSYLKGVGCGKVVKEISNTIVNMPGSVVGWKADLSKYFDSVPIEYIDWAFDQFEKKFGHSIVIDVLRKYYHSNKYYDLDKKLVEDYKSLKQGCAVASWLADVILYHIDEKLSDLDVSYTRYCDDIGCFGKDHKKAMRILKEELGKMGMKLNPKKVEYIKHGQWFKFLGFNLNEDKRTVSKKRLKTFQSEIKKRTKHGTSFERAKNSVNRYLFKGRYSWASTILSVVNVEHDLDLMSQYILDRLRAVQTDHYHIGGLGCVMDRPEGCVVRGKGRQVRSNRDKTEKEIEGIITLVCAQKALVTDKNLFKALISNL